MYLFKIQIAAVSGRGIKMLEEAWDLPNLGLCKKILRLSSKLSSIGRLQKGRLRILKWAMSNTMAEVGLKNGKSKWISNEGS